MRQIQRQRFFQDHDVDALTQLRAQQRLRERNPALRHGGGGDQQRFEGDIAHHIVEVGRAGALMQIGGVNHGIDDLRADVGDARRQHAGNQREHGESDAQGLVGAPHQPERAAAVVEHTSRLRRQLPAPPPSADRGPPKCGELPSWAD